MGLLVGLAGRRVREGLAALAAGEGLLTRVDSDVPLEVPCVRELLPTVLALVDDRAVGLGLCAVAISA